MNRAKTIRREQERAGIARGARIDAEIEAVLAGEEELIPSSGFVASVMESVRQEAALPPPIPFPWKWAVPGILLASAVFGWGAFEMVSIGLPAHRLTALLHSIAFPPPHLSAAMAHPAGQLGWVALGLGAALASWLLSRRLAGSGGLL